MDTYLIQCLSCKTDSKQVAEHIEEELPESYTDCSICGSKRIRVWILVHEVDEPDEE